MWQDCSLQSHRRRTTSCAWVRIIAPCTGVHAKSGYHAGTTAADAIPEHPIIFTKPSSSISGPYDDIPLWPGLDEAVDYEAELAVVIGKGGRFIPRERALDHVFGFTIINDVTARDLQRVHKQWFLGKGIDGFGPIGAVDYAGQ